MVRVADNPIALQVKLADIRANLSNSWIYEKKAENKRLRDKYKLALTTLGKMIVEKEEK